MSDFQLHVNALELLLRYYECEQYTAHDMTPQILMTLNNVAQELRTLKTHLTWQHQYDDSATMINDITLYLAEITEAEKTLRKLYFSRKDVRD